MLQRIPRPLLRRAFQRCLPNTTRRTLVAAPKEGSGPLLERRSDRELPTVAYIRRSPILRTLPLFILAMFASAAAIFNYQKANSSVVESSLYALRTSPLAEKYLGREIYFARRIPWIWGSLDQVHGKIDIQFMVAGTKGRGMMKFRAERSSRMSFFKTVEWTLTLDDGTVVDLMEGEGVDPTAVAGGQMAVKV